MGDTVIIQDSKKKKDDEVTVIETADTEKPKKAIITEKTVVTEIKDDDE